MQQLIPAVRQTVHPLVQWHVVPSCFPCRSHASVLNAEYVHIDYTQNPNIDQCTYGPETPVCTRPCLRLPEYHKYRQWTTGYLYHITTNRLVCLHPTFRILAFWHTVQLKLAGCLKTITYHAISMVSIPGKTTGFGNKARASSEALHASYLSC